MLEVSVTDGLLSSYAKLDAIKLKPIEKSNAKVIYEVKTKWITPLEKIENTEFITVVKRKSKWYIQKNTLDTDLPPDQLYSINKTAYFNQGRRRITTEQTYHEDVLKQPVLEIISAKLVKVNNSYAIIGEIQNIDNVPSDVVLKGTLYNDDNKELASYNAKYHMKHKLLPKEVSSFKINFEGIAWSKTKDSIPKTFNPDEFTPIEFSEQPTKFNLQAAGNVSNSDLFKNIVLSDLEIQNENVTGTLFNSGIQEITVPQVLVSYYNDDKEIVWVDHIFVKDGIRQQRKRNFNFNINKHQNIKIISSDMKNCFVNGLPNSSISDKMLPERNLNHNYYNFQKVDMDDFKFLKIEMNSYIGNPN